MMRKRLSLVLVGAIALATAVQGQVIFSDNFEAYDVESSSDFSTNTVATGNWVPSLSTSTGSRILDSTRYGITRYFICQTDGASITSAGIDIASDTTYDFSAFMAVEHNADRTGTSSYDLLVGQDASTATSVFGGPVEVFVTATPQATTADKASHMFTDSFTTGTLNAGDQLFIRLARVNQIVGPMWTAFDDVTVTAIPEPATLGMVAVFGGGILFIRRKLMM
jgi:hypothetical protein